MPINNEKVDVLVIGAGPSGSASAAIVHREGLSVKVVEKTVFPRFVIGESLLPRCMDHLEAMGVLEAVAQHGFQKKIGATFRRGKSICRFEFAQQYSSSWDWTWQVPRAQFDKVVADEVEAQGVDYEYACSVVAVEFQGSASITTVCDSAGNEKKIEAKFVIDASGYGRVLPRLLNLDKPSTFPCRSSVFTHVTELEAGERVDRERITVISQTQEVWIWVIPFSNGRTSIGYTGSSAYFDQFEGDTNEILVQLINSNDYMKERFSSSSFAFDARRIDAYATDISKLHGEGFVLTGNCGEFLDPIFSSGVTLALESGVLAASLVARQLKGETIDWERQYAQYMSSGIDVFRTYVESWYEGTLQDIFYGDIQEGSVKSQITSILAGHVWDENNPMISKTQEFLRALSKLMASS